MVQPTGYVELKEAVVFHVLKINKNTVKVSTRCGNEPPVTRTFKLYDKYVANLTVNFNE